MLKIPLLDIDNVFYQITPFFIKKSWKWELNVIRYVYYLVCVSIAESPGSQSLCIINSLLHINDTTSINIGLKTNTD